MNTLDQQQRKDAIKGLINIAIVEGFVLMVVVGVYFWSSNLTYLIGGIIGSSLIFGPMFLRWHKEYRNALKQNAEEGEP